MGNAVPTPRRYQTRSGNGSIGIRVRIWTLATGLALRLLRPTRVAECALTKRSTGRAGSCFLLGEPYRGAPVTLLIRRRGHPHVDSQGRISTVQAHRSIQPRQVAG